MKNDGIDFSSFIWEARVMKLSQKSISISGSLTLAIDAKAKKMKAEGMDVIGFGAGEPDFETPQFIIEAAKEALDKGYTRYTPASGMMELKEAICEKLQNDNNLKYTPSEIIVSNGAKHSLYNIFQAILNPGDEVIIPTPYWVTYPELVKMGGGTPIFLDTKEENGFKIDITELEQAVTEKTKALIINSPGNPSGCVYSRKELEAIADLAVKKEFFVISDEIYEKLVYDGNEHISIASLNSEIKNITLVVNGMSKAYAMTGWRIGYTAGNEEVIKVMSNIQSHATSNPNSIAQYASIAALRGPQDIIYQMVSEFEKRRKYMIDRIRQIEGLSCNEPKGAFYLMLNIGNALGRKYRNHTITGSMDFAEQLLDAYKVAVVPGLAFGADKYVRLSYATSIENIEKGLDRIESFMNELE